MFAGSLLCWCCLFDVYWCVASLRTVLSIYVLWSTRCCLLATLAHSLQLTTTSQKHSGFNSQVTKGVSCVQLLQGIRPPWLQENRRLGLSVTLVSNPWCKHTMNTPGTVWDLFRIHIVNLVSLTNLFGKKNSRLAGAVFFKIPLPWGAHTADQFRRNCHTWHFDHGGGCRRPGAAEVGQCCRAIPTDSHHSIDEEAIRDGPKHAEQKEGPQIGGANMV